MRCSPDYFSYAPGIEYYCNEALKPENFTLVASLADSHIGFAVLSKLNQSTIEIITMAVLPLYRRRGIGSALLADIEARALECDRKFLLMKTIGPGHKTKQGPYQFLLKRKFSMLDEFDFIWQDSYCAIMVKEAC